jgi:hypothetical protein
MTPLGEQAAQHVAHSNMRPLAGIRTIALALIPRGA